MTFQEVLLTYNFYIELNYKELSMRKILAICMILFTGAAIACGGAKGKTVSTDSPEQPIVTSTSGN